MKFERVHSANDRAVPDDYRRIKFEVFAREFGWPIPPEAGTNLAEPDPFDSIGYFLIARTEDGTAVGCARVVALRDGFPHRSLLEPVLGQIGADKNRWGTLNAVAVTAEWRGRSPDGQRAQSPATVAGQMVADCHAWLRELGLAGCVLTTTEVVANRFFEPMGYARIGPAFTSGLYSASLVNMHRTLA
jgi:hypothetical protein